MLCVCVWFQQQSTLLHCFFGKPLVLTKPAPHPSYPLLWSLRIPQPSNPSPNVVCVCVVPATINTALLLFGKPLGLTKQSQHPSMRTCTLLSIFVHSFSSLSPSFSLTFSFLNLSFLLSPFSIFLSYFLLFLSFSVYVPKTLSLTI